MVSLNEINAEEAVQESMEAVAVQEIEIDEAFKKYQLGKKNLLLNKFDEAVNNIGDACKA